MFLCDDCHDVGQHREILFRSFGNCESCGRAASCIDCHHKECTAPNEPRFCASCGEPVSGLDDYCTACRIDAETNR